MFEILNNLRACCWLDILSLPNPSEYNSCGLYPAMDHSWRVWLAATLTRLRSTWDMLLLEQCFWSVSVSGCFQKRWMGESEWTSYRRLTHIVGRHPLCWGLREKTDENGLSAHGDMLFSHPWVPEIQSPLPLDSRIHTNSALRHLDFPWARTPLRQHWNKQIANTCSLEVIQVARCCNNIL